MYFNKKNGNRFRLSYSLPQLIKIYIIMKIVCYLIQNVTVLITADGFACENTNSLYLMPFNGKFDPVIGLMY